MENRNTGDNRTLDLGINLQGEIVSTLFIFKARIRNAFLIMNTLGGENVHLSTRNFNQTRPPTKHILRWEHFDALVPPKASTCDNLRLQPQGSRANLERIPRA